MHHLFAAVVALIAFLQFFRQSDANKLGGLDVFVVGMEYGWPGGTPEWRAEATNCLDRIFDFGRNVANSRFGFGCSKAMLLHPDPGIYYISFNRSDPIVTTTLTGCVADGDNSVLNVLVKYKEIAQKDFHPDRSILTIFLADQYLKTDLVDNENALFFAKIPNEVLVIVKSDELSDDALFKLALGYIDDSWIMPFELGGCTDEFVENFKKAVCVSITGEPQSTEPCQSLTPGNCTRKITYKSSLHRGETICRNYLRVDHEPCECLTTKFTTTTEQDGVTDVKNSTNSESIAAKHSSTSALLFGLVVGGTIVVIGLIVAVIVVYVVCWRNREKQSAAVSKSAPRAKKGASSVKRPGLRSSGSKKLQKSTSKRFKSAKSITTTSLSKSKITTSQKSGLKSRMAGSKLAESHGAGSKKSKSRTITSNIAKPHGTKSKSVKSHGAGSKMSKSGTTKSHVASSKIVKSHGSGSKMTKSSMTSSK